MSSPKILFKQVAPVVSGVLPKLAYGKYDTKLNLTLSTPCHVAAPKLAAVIRRKLGSDSKVYVKQSSDSIVQVCFNEAEVVDSEATFDFPLFRKISSISQQHITSKQLTAVKSNYGAVLRDELWLKKFKYKTKIDVGNYLSDSRYYEIMSALSTTFANDAAMVQSFLDDYYPGFGSDDYDPKKTYNKGIMGGKNGNDSTIRLSPSGNILIYSTDSGIGMLLSMLIDTSKKLSLHMEEAILPSEI